MPLLKGVILTTAGVAVGSIVSIMSASAVAVSAAQISVGADTPVHGVTVGLMVVGLVAGVGMVWTGGRYIFQLGGEVREWRAALNDAKTLARLVREIEKGKNRNTEILDKVVGDLGALERWRAQVDPILTEWRRRSGIKEA